MPKDLQGLPYADGQPRPQLLGPPELVADALDQHGPVHEDEQGHGVEGFDGRREVRARAAREHEAEPAQYAALLLGEAVLQNPDDDVPRPRGRGRDRRDRIADRGGGCGTRLVAWCCALVWGAVVYFVET